MFGKINRKWRFHAAVFDQVVKGGSAFVILQAVDDRIPAIIGYDHDNFMPTQHGGINIRIHHHIGAIADNHDGGAVFIGHRGAPPCGDFIAHAGKAKFGVYRIGGFDAPAFIHFTRRAPSRGDHQIFCFGVVLHHFNHLRVGGYMRITGFLQLINQAVPFGHFIAAFLHPSVRGRPVA